MSFKSPFKENEFPFICTNCPTRLFVTVNSLEETRRVRCPSCGSPMRCILKPNLLASQLPAKSANPLGCIGFFVFMFVIGLVIYNMVRFNDKSDKYEINKSQSQAELISNVQGIIDNADSKVDRSHLGIDHYPCVVDAYIGENEFRFVILIQGTDGADKLHIDKEACEYAEKIAFGVPKGSMVHVRLIDKAENTLSKARCQADKRPTLTAVNEE